MPPMPPLAITEDALFDKVLAGQRIDRADAAELYRLPLHELGELANRRRDLAKRAAYGGRGAEIVTYIIDRNINYTNVCDVYCKFCAFYRTEKDADHYVLSSEELDQKLDELTAIGGVQILMQGGHHPSLGIDWYLKLLAHIRAKYPHINIHGFCPPEFNHFAQVFGLPLRQVLTRISRPRDWARSPAAGARSSSIACGIAIAPLKCNSDQWLEVMAIAHELGLKSSATMMFGHVETVEDRIEHLERVRELQDETGGFTAFICWTISAGPQSCRQPHAPGRGSSGQRRVSAHAGA